jgi:kojibiose phosphorylase
MVAAEFGNLDFAYSYFMKTAQIDIEAKYKVYVGTIFMGGSHPAANGGAWMTAVFGFGGLRADDKQLVINPRLYKTWNSMRFSMVYKGDRFNIKITRESVDIIANASNKSTHTFLVSGNSMDCAPGKLSSVRYQNADAVHSL